MAEASKAQATAAQAGPLAEAQAKQAVVEQETKVAGLEAQRKEAELFATVQKPADAEAYKTKITADAARQATISAAEAEAQKTKLLGDAQASADKARGEGEAAAIGARGEAEGAALRAKGLAEADAIKARAAALAENQEAVVAQQIAAEPPGDRPGGVEGVRQHRPADRPERRGGHGRALQPGARHGRGGDPGDPFRARRLAAAGHPGKNGHKEAPIEVKPPA